MIAIEAKYHEACLVALYNEVRAKERTSKDKPETNIMKSVIFAQSVSYITKYNNCKEQAPVFLLSDLVKMYQENLNHHGFPEHVHTTRLKERLLAHIPGLTSYKKRETDMFAL